MRRQHALEAPPQQDQEQGLRPEVDGEPDELRIEGRGRRRQEARARGQRASARATHGGNEQGAQHGLRPLGGLEASQHRMGRGQEIRIAREDRRGSGS